MSKEVIDDSLFKPLPKDEKFAEDSMRPSISVFKESIINILKNKMAVIGFVFIVLIFFLAMFGPHMVPYGHSEQVLEDANLAPSAEHWFGTDGLGRDMWVRTWLGARVSLAVGLAATAIDLILGVVIGGIAGYAAGRGKVGDRIDGFLMRLIEILYGIPYLLVVILLLVVMEPGLLTIIIALAATGWVGMARIIRGQVLQLSTQDYVQAAQKLGTSHWKIITRHLWPNTLNIIIVNLSFTIPTAIFSEAFLSFIGLGVQAPFASLGTMANDALNVIFSGEWWQLFFPGLIISITMFAFNVFGDGVQDALDPIIKE